jgi:two-component system phosphate regulon response regulator PhoB
MLQFLFRDDPVNCVVATNGTDGLRLACELLPDLVILDLMLPDISGHQVFLQMQSDPQLKDIPVWVLSVKWYKADSFPWREPAIVSYTFKPFAPYQFRERVLHWLGVEKPGISAA